MGIMEKKMVQGATWFQNCRRVQASFTDVPQQLEGGKLVNILLSAIAQRSLLCALTCFLGPTYGLLIGHLGLSMVYVPRD